MEIHVPAAIEDNRMVEVGNFLSKTNYSGINGFKRITGQ